MNGVKSIQCRIAIALQRQEGDVAGVELERAIGPLCAGRAGRPWKERADRQLFGANRPVPKKNKGTPEAIINDTTGKKRKSKKQNEKETSPSAERDATRIG